MTDAIPKQKKNLRPATLQKIDLWNAAHPCPARTARSSGRALGLLLAQLGSIP